MTGRQMGAEGICESIADSAQNNKPADSSGKEQYRDGRGRASHLSGRQSVL